MVETSGSAGSRRAGQAGSSDAKGDLTEDLRKKAQDTAGEAGDRARSILGRQKENAAEQVHSVADALRETASRLDDGGSATIAEYTERAAEGLEALASDLRDKDVPELLNQVERYARRHPELFLGASVAVGFLLARFLRSSRQSRGDGGTSGGYGRSQGYGAQGPGQTSRAGGRSGSEVDTMTRSLSEGGF